MTPLQMIKVLRVADSYATTAVRVHAAKTRAKLTGDSMRRIDKQRDAAREKLVNLLGEIVKQNQDNKL